MVKKVSNPSNRRGFRPPHIIFLFMELVGIEPTSKTKKLCSYICSQKLVTLNYVTSFFNLY